MTNTKLLDPKQLMRARKFMKQHVNAARGYDRSRAESDVKFQLESLNLAFDRAADRPDAALRHFVGVTSREFIHASRAIVFDQEDAYQNHPIQPREAACLAYYGFHLQHLEFERTINIAPRRTTRFTMHDIPGALVAPLLSASAIPTRSLGAIGDSLVGYYQLACDVERYATHHLSDDHTHAKIEMAGTAAFAANALLLAKGYVLPAPVTFPEDPAEQGLDEALRHVLGDVDEARYAFRIGMERHGYRVIQGKPYVGLIRTAGMVPYPFEYLILKQIRTCQGLENPPFEHVLLYPEYERLHNAFTWFDPREHPVMGQFIQLYEDWSGQKFEIAWPPVEIAN